MLILSDSVNNIPNVGQSMARRFNSMGIFTIQDLLLFFPYKYFDFSSYVKINQIKQDTESTIRVKVKTIASRFSFKTKKSVCEAVVCDETGCIKVSWFGQGYLSNSIKPGEELFLSGKCRFYKGLVMVNPVHEKITENNIHTGRIVPKYRLPKGLYNKTLRSILHKTLVNAENFPDFFPESIKRKYKLMGLTEAVKEMHFPKSMGMLETARHRLMFEEVFIQQLAAIFHKQRRKEYSSPKILANVNLIKKFLGRLPFELTSGQKKALWEVMQDTEKTVPMNRLIEGDVGSGKTLVAIAASLNVAASKFQTALLAPTEILAKQHYESFSKFSKSIALLTGSFSLLAGKAMPKKELLSAIAKGKTNHVIGTHALLQESVDFKNLGLIIIDEQHRFGVSQRAKIPKLKSKKHEYIPHLLSMTATPIPRTLALTIFGDLAVSQLTEMPRNRQEIKTKIVAEANRSQVYETIRKEITKGRQVFVVTSRVEAQDEDNADEQASQTKAAKSEFIKLSREIFPEFRVGLLYGKMKSSEKEKIMSDFSEGKLDILVSSSVIEIGIDIPNATIIVIEGAQNFGLAQLHQLRGRVGRGSFPSKCFLFSDTLEEWTMERLNYFASCNNGFLLAQKDLEQRGFGSLFGEDQTGFSLKFGQFLNFKTLKITKQAALDFYNTNPDLTNYPSLKNKILPLLEQIHLE